MDSHQLYQLNGTDGRTDDYWKAELGAEVTVTGVAFAIFAMSGMHIENVNSLSLFNRSMSYNTALDTNCQE